MIQLTLHVSLGKSVLISAPNLILIILYSNKKMNAIEDSSVIQVFKLDRVKHSELVTYQVISIQLANNYSE